MEKLLEIIGTTLIDADETKLLSRILKAAYKKIEPVEKQAQKLLESIGGEEKKIITKDWPHNFSDGEISKE